MVKEGFAEQVILIHLSHSEIFIEHYCVPDTVLGSWVLRGVTQDRHNL